MMPLLMTTLMAVVPVHDRGRVMGNVTLAISVAPALGPAVSGIVLSSLSWRWIFLVVLPAAVGIAVFGLRRLRNVGEPVAGTIDWWSVVIAAIGFGNLVYGLSEVGRQGERGTAYAALAVGVVGVAVFVWRQLLLQRDDRPLLDLRTLKQRVFTISLGAMAIAFMAMLGSMILLQLYLQNVRGMSPLATGLLVMPGGLAMGLLGPRVGRVYDEHGSRVLMIPGAIGIVASMTAFAFVGATTPLWAILVAHVVLMVSLAAMFTPLFTMGLGSLLAPPVLPRQLPARHGAAGRRRDGHRPGGDGAGQSLRQPAGRRRHGRGRDDRRTPLELRHLGGPDPDRAGPGLPAPRPGRRPDSARGGDDARGRGRRADDPVRGGA